MKCPHCLHLFHQQLDLNDVGDGPEGTLKTLHQTCPVCGKSIVFLQFRNQFNTVINTLLIYPKGTTRSPIPSEVDDQQVIDDYSEAALVLTDSPKASAALSRRCLQHILREKTGVKKSDLANEIQEILNSNTLPSGIAQNLDAIRNIGNFGTHPIKSTNTGEIINVEPEEAEWNLEVLEQLIDFYYVRSAIAKKKRDELNEKLTAAGKPTLK